MRNRFSTAIILAIFLATITATVVLAAAPPLHSSFDGTVTIGGLANSARHMRCTTPVNRAVKSRIHAAWFVTRELIRGRLKC